MIKRTIRRLRRLVLRALFVGVVIGAVCGATFMWGMRTKSPHVQRAVRRMNKVCWNPKVLETAGTADSAASVVHHTGRRSGTEYDTPVVPVATDDGFVIALPYGIHADWVQNVLTAGRATITHDGETHDVHRPEVVPTSMVDQYFSESDRKMHRTFRVDECLRLHRVTAVRPSGDEVSEAASVERVDEVTHSAS